MKRTAIYAAEMNETQQPMPPPIEKASESLKLVGWITMIVFPIAGFVIALIVLSKRETKAGLVMLVVSCGAMAALGAGLLGSDL